MVRDFSLREDVCRIEISETGPTLYTMPATYSSRYLVGIWYLFALSLVGLDQATKYAIETLMPLRSSIAVGPFFNLVHVLNPGAAFSFLADAGGWQRYLFVGLGVGVSAFLALGLWRGLRSRLETAAYICVIGALWVMWLTACALARWSIFWIFTGGSGIGRPSIWPTSSSSVVPRCWSWPV